MELPRLQELQDQYQDKGFEVVAVEATHDTDRAKAFIKRKDLKLDFLEDRENDGVVSNVFGVHSFPTSFLIDRKGRVMYYHLGFDPGDEKGIAKEIESLL